MCSVLPLFSLVYRMTEVIAGWGDGGAGCHKIYSASWVFLKYRLKFRSPYQHVRSAGTLRWMLDINLHFTHTNQLAQEFKPETINSGLFLLIRCLKQETNFHLDL